MKKNITFEKIITQTTCYFEPKIKAAFIRPLHFDKDQTVIKTKYPSYLWTFYII